MSELTTVRAALDEAAASLECLRRDEAMLATIARAGELLADTFVAGGRAYSCGNGGAMCDAMHFAEEWTGRFRDDRPGMRRSPSATRPPELHRQRLRLRARSSRASSRRTARSGDLLVAITTSGTSRNVVAAAQSARALGMKVIGLTGRAGTPIVGLADIPIVTPGGTYADRVQELHIKVIHILIELVERRLAPDNYKAQHAAPQ